MASKSTKGQSRPAAFKRELLKSVQVVQSIFNFFDNVDTSYQPFCLKISTHIVCDSSKVRAKGFLATSLQRGNNDMREFRRVIPPARDEVTKICGYLKRYISNTSNKPTHFQSHRLERISQPIIALNVAQSSIELVSSLNTLDMTP